MTLILGSTIFSLIMISLPKLYAFTLALMITFKCVREEDSRRKYAFRILTFNEFRVQAMNVEYTTYKRHKTEFLFALYKFLFEDLIQFITQVYYLTSTDCGTKNPNPIVYFGIACAVLNTYFGLVFRLCTYCYSYKRLNSYKRKIEVRISTR